MPRYIFRIDDVHPKMDWRKFNRLKNLLFDYDIRPIIAVIPDNKDQELNRGEENYNFWEEIKNFQTKKCTIAMHGYQHKSINRKSGILKICNRSEFADLSYAEQLEKIKKGKKILEDRGVKTEIFVAPGHSFDKNTIKALKEEGFNYISDGIALWPFRKYNIVWIPQIVWMSRKILVGIATFCLHSDILTERDFQKIEKFIREHKKQIIDLQWILRWYKTRNQIERVFFYFFNIIFKPIWYLGFNISKLKDKTNVRN